MARGVPVRVLGFAFLALVGVTAATATPAVGALLLLGLLATPAGAAQRISARSVPPSFAILAMATASYVAAWLATARGSRRRERASAAAA